MYHHTLKTYLNNANEVKVSDVLFTSMWRFTGVY